MSIKTKVEKLEKQLAEVKEVENKKNYKYLFNTRKDFELAKVKGQIDPKGIAIIIDE